MHNFFYSLIASKLINDDISNQDLRCMVPIIERNLFDCNVMYFLRNFIMESLHRLKLAKRKKVKISKATKSCKN